MHSTINPYDDRDTLIEMFNEIGIRHGETFDDGRRWCGVCEIPRFARPKEAIVTWMDKVCPDCHAVWPEHVEECIAGIVDDDDELDEFSPHVIN